jgi:hypothetical protein
MITFGIPFGAQIASDPVIPEFVGSASEAHHDLPMRDNNHPMIRSYGSRLLC